MRRPFPPNIITVDRDQCKSWNYMPDAKGIGVHNFRGSTIIALVGPKVIVVANISNGLNRYLPNRGMAQWHLNVEEAASRNMQDSLNTAVIRYEGMTGNYPNQVVYIIAGRTENGGIILRDQVREAQDEVRRYRWPQHLVTYKASDTIKDQWIYFEPDRNFVKAEMEEKVILVKMDLD